MPAFSLTTAMLWGVEARPIRVEVNLSAGLPGIAIVGRPDPSVVEARSRVRCAVRTTGFQIPRTSITVNLAPADQRKAGAGFDLPIAVAILAATGQIPTRGLERCLIVGELALDGTIVGVKGLLAYAKLARDLGLRLIAPQGSLHGCFDDVDARAVRSLSQFADGVQEAGCPFDRLPDDGVRETSVLRDFSEVAGQEVAKRALCIAAAGGLGILMIGPPGVGKTMLASCMPGVLPAMSEAEYFETALVHSVAGSSDPRVAHRQRPFRAPHHSVGVAGLLGGGRPVGPGEVSLAHHGVLFLDELGEFNRHVLQAMRQPMEEGVVRLTRVDGTYSFPCRFQLVAASNPCPCGHLGDTAVPCTCSAAAVESYRAKLAGPLIDRIDLAVGLERPDANEILGAVRGSSTADLKTRVEAGREFRKQRLAHTGSEGARRAELAPPAGRVARAVVGCDMSPSARRLFESLVQTRVYSVRALMSVAKVARAIADLDESGFVEEGHLLEAVGYRDKGVMP